jgi:isoprenylcysteine carboxyl methyltransferase (ICMT) family protein YpbQ
MQTNVHSICYLTQFLLNVAQHVSSLCKAHLQGALLLKLQELYYWYIKFLKSRRCILLLVSENNVKTSLS